MIERTCCKLLWYKADMLMHSEEGKWKWKKILSQVLFLQQCVGIVKKRIISVVGIYEELRIYFRNFFFIEILNMKLGNMFSKFKLKLQFVWSFRYAVVYTYYSLIFAHLNALPYTICNCERCRPPFLLKKEEEKEKVSSKMRGGFYPSY